MQRMHSYFRDSKQILKTLCGTLSGGKKPEISFPNVFKMVQDIHEKLAPAILVVRPDEFDQNYKHITDNVKTFIRLASQQFSRELEFWKIHRNEKEYFNFARNEVLNLENIVCSAFKNSDKHKFDEICEDWGFQTFPECDERLILRRIENILPSAMLQFDTSQIRLHDTSTFQKLSNKEESVSRNLYIQDIKPCKWYGPYKHKKKDFICFIALNGQANNSYQIGLWIQFEDKNITLTYQKNNSLIADLRYFGDDEESQDGEGSGEEEEEETE